MQGKCIRGANVVTWSVTGLTWRHHHEGHCETGRQVHACQGVSSKLSCHEQSGKTRHGQELGVYSRSRRMGYSEIREIGLHFTEEGGYSKSQKFGSRHGTTKVESIQARGGLTWS